MLRPSPARGALVASLLAVLACARDGAGPSASAAAPAPAASDAPGPWVGEDFYFARPGMADEVYRTRVRACDVLESIGLQRGLVFRGPGGDGPDVVWQSAPHATLADSDRARAARIASPRFREVVDAMGPRVRRFEQRVLREVTSEAADGGLDGGAIPDVPTEERPVVTENFYFALPGRADDVLRVRRAACDVLEKVGTPRGLVLRGASTDAPDVAWLSAPFPSLDAVRQANARLDASDFEDVTREMPSLLRRFERRRFVVVRTRVEEPAPPAPRRPSR